ncbi:MAG TPA: alanine--tRNA ligase, partial [Bacillales bacterium]|nr:alanine--tRNA ligase [Bacillales bacterium]
RFAKTLGLDEPFMYRLVPVVAEIMEDFYPEVKEKTPFIQKVVEKEEERFHATINEGLAILKDMMASEKEKGNQILSGRDAFKLYDTYGFPYELTEEYLAEEGMNVDREQFEKELEAQRARARAARQTEGSMQIQGGVLADIDVKSEFVGYGETETVSSVSVIVHNDELVDVVGKGEKARMILDRTPFYAESGGQVADHGEMIGENVKLIVTDVQKAPNGQHLHSIVVQEGTLRKGDQLTAKINEADRIAITRNHTATHLLHQALKDVLGPEANQAGSLVAPDRLRFDFTHYRQVTDEELEKIEAIVNEKIWENLDVETMQKSLDEAKAMGAMALFGEKYGDVVRIVNVKGFSLELCGGCHVRNTATIGLFKITMETGIGAGTRRIEAVTGQAAYHLMNERVGVLAEAAQMLHSNLHDVPARIDSMQKQIRDLEREKESLATKIGNAEAKDLASQAEDVDGIPVIAKKVEVHDMNLLRTMVDELKGKLGSGIVVLGAISEGKVSLAAGVTKDLTKKGYHAGKLIKETAAKCGGGGGGRPDMAQAGGKNPEKLDEALQFVVEWVKQVS